MKSLKGLAQLNKSGGREKKKKKQVIGEGGRKKIVIKVFSWNVIFHAVQRKRSSGLLQY